MFRWYVINTYSGHENKVKHNLEHRVETMGQGRKVRQVVVPDRGGLRGQGRQEGQRREAHDAGLRARADGDDRRRLGAGQEHARRHRLRRLAQQAAAALAGRGRQPAAEGGPRAGGRDRRRRWRSGAPVSGGPGAEQRAKPQAQYEIGETVKVISGPLSDFSGEIAEINDDAAKLKVLVSIFGRETPVEVGYDQVKKV